MIIAYGGGEALYGWMAHLATGIPYLLSLRGAIPGLDGNRLVDKVHLLSNNSWRYAEGIVLPSKKYSEYVMENYPGMSNIVFIPNGIDHKMFNITGDRTRNGSIVHFVSTSRIARTKGLEFFVEASINLHERGYGHCVDFVGDGNLRPTLEERTDRYREHVKFHGHKPHNQVSGYLQYGDIFVLPSMREGFANVVTEAMASGLAVISTDVGISHDLLDENGGFFIRFGDIEDLESAMETYLRNPNLAKRHGLHNNELMQSFPSWKEVAQMYVDYINEILAFRKNKI